MINKFFILLVFANAVSIAFSQENAKVIRVKDGDTYVLLSQNNKHTVRLLNVDAPELNQNWGLQAHRKVKELILGKDVRFETIKKDKYGRELASIYLNGQRLDSTLIVNGWAWHYVNYNQNENLESLMHLAKENGSGLWECSNEKVCPPWLFRHYNIWNKNRYCKGCKITKKIIINN